MTRHIMGMPVTMEVVAGEGPARLAMEAAFEYLRWVDETFSTYKEDSVISRINRGDLAAGDAEPVVRRVLAACDEMRDRTDGYFDIRRPDGIDPSGYVKGWAIRGAAGKLGDAGFEDYFVEAGGDLQAHGHSPEGGPWRVGVRNPLARSEIVKVLGVTDGAVATSGNYERGEHIYDPHTGRPVVDAAASVTVLGPDIVWADVAATAAFAMGPGAAAWVARQPELEAYVIGHDGRATFTPVMKKYFR